MHGQPKRRGGMAPEDQVRGVGAFAKPGQFDEDSQEPDLGHDRKAAAAGRRIARSIGRRKRRRRGRQ
eukprot:2076212-Heterocapsa_arctica.AAC.1